MAVGEASIVLENVTKRFGAFVAVDDVSFSIPVGAVWGFLGQNGAGKTTTIRMIMGILGPDRGRIRVLDATDSATVRHRLGYLPEEKGLYKKMRAREQLAYFARLKGLSRKEARSRADDLLVRYGLGDFLTTPCEALSKGMGQKVQVLAALIHRPDLVILDEPFSGLDPVNVELMREIILDVKRGGGTVIFSTHVMEQAEQICDGVIMIHRGKKVLDGPLSTVKSGGGRSIRLDYDGDGSLLRNLPGVARLNDAGKSAEILLEDGVDPQAVLQALVGRIGIRRFDLREPSLHELFVRRVQESTHA